MMVEIDCEIISLILFALGHIYLGLLAVINAAFAYFILRLCYKKTGSLIPGITAHFIYNILQLVYYSLL
ncbi:MAG: CPBP family intramembrane metalloprotease [Clostridia bacterium]|nr:CPBP family intramembrane metalloprotease [Clostridia bacterium]